MAVGAIAREACDVDDDGVFLLLVYLNRARATLSRKHSVEDVQSRLKAVIELLVSRYPPGENLADSGKNFKDALTEIEIVG